MRSAVSARIRVSPANTELSGKSLLPLSAMLDLLRTPIRPPNDADDGTGHAPQEPEVVGAKPPVDAKTAKAPNGNAEDYLP